MSDRADQRTSSYSYSPGWRQFSRIILHPGLRLLMKHRWQGKENIPGNRRHHPGPEPPVLRRLAHDRPVQRRLRAPVPGVHDQVADLRGQGDRAFDVQVRPAARVPGPRRRRPGAEAGRAGAAGGRLRDRLPGGDRDPRPGPVADGGPDGRRAAGADHRGAGDPDRALGRAGDPPLRVEEAPPVPAQDGADGGRAAGGPVRLRRPAAGASTLRAATADIMADITALLAKIRQETPPAIPWDPAAGGRVSLGQTEDGATSGSAASPAEAAQADETASGQT